MYIAMNRFKVLKDCTKDFENAWFSRESYLHELPRLRLIPPAARPRARGSHPLFVPHDVALLRRL